MRAADISALGRYNWIASGNSLRGQRLTLDRWEPGQCVEIMTGAAVPDGADAVVMIEYTRRAGSTITIDCAAHSGDHIDSTRQRSARAGDVLLPAGLTAGIRGNRACGSGGNCDVPSEKYSCEVPRVAILSTGDEVVVCRTSNRGHFRCGIATALPSKCLARNAGAEPIALGNAPDQEDALRTQIARGLDISDILVLSGGVSMGKYDLVEQVLANLGAEFYFTGVAIRPGRPAVFADVPGTSWFSVCRGIRYQPWLRSNSSSCPPSSN